MVDPILKDFPDHFETDRLLIRCPRSGDGQAFYEAVHESISELGIWLPWVTIDYTPDQAEAFVRRACAYFILRQEFWMLVFLKSAGTFLGACGLHHIDWNVPSFEIGYWLRTTYSGHGYMTEAVNGLTQFAREYLRANRITIGCDIQNTRSKAVAERAGYTLESYQRNERRKVDGKLRDSYVFVKTWPE
ncbi:MAG: GNAT family N-acetyltransferase [Aggregatilineales bacterium]